VTCKTKTEDVNIDPKTEGMGGSMVQWLASIASSCHRPTQLSISPGSADYGPASAGKAKADMVGIANTAQYMRTSHREL